MEDKYRSEGWVTPGWRPYTGEENVLQTFVAPEVRKDPPAQSVNMDRCDDAALNRWKADE